MEGLWALTKSSCGAGRGEGLVCLVLFICRPPPPPQPPQLSVAREDRPRRSHAWKRQDDPESRAWQTTRLSVTSQLNIALQRNKTALIVEDPFHGPYPDIKVGQMKFCGSVHFGLFVCCAFGLYMIASD